MDTIAELYELCGKLSQKRDRINQIIRTFNDKLKRLNFYADVWLNEVFEVPRRDLEIPMGDLMVSEHDDYVYHRRDAILLGYVPVEGEQQLATKWARYSSTSLIVIDDDGGETREKEMTKEIYYELPQSLLTAPLGVRAEAMRLIPALLEKIRSKAQAMLHDLETAEKVAEKL